MTTENIKSMIAITEAFCDGQRITGIAIEYSEPLKNTDVSGEAFEVEGRTITEVYTNTAARPAREAKDGPYVIIKLSPEDEGCETLERPGGPEQKSGADRLKTGKADAEKMDPEAKSGRKKMRSLNSKRREIFLTVSQIKELTAVSGKVFPTFQRQKTTGIWQEIIDNFQQFQWEGMDYDLYIPRDYDPAGTYPLVMFIPDATGGGKDPLICLEQGNGAVNFAKERDQKKHPAFVLGIQYGLEEPLTRDDFTVNEEGIRQIFAVLDHVISTYSIDRDRIYTTGQSMGCMASCELNIRRPDFFAASLLVAGQWDPEKMGRLYRNNFWILVSEHDAKAFPGMNAVTAAMEANGGRAGRYFWNAKAGKKVLEEAVKRAAAEDCNLRYTVFEGDTVVPDGKEANPGSNHMSTWPVVYGIDALRDWLFTQKKEG